ncbi:cytochrome P450 2G1-like [Bombina bombina]|uniref:cytochrome P450 2G1-like n=1 Tax=Bombina bombina TaxID=8345 RepID=UPI00235B055A|nr:cytochrome P450 2G1-like [Bombina bombina]
MIAFCISLIILILGFKTAWKTHNLPPGPTPLPVLGNILQIRRGDIVQSLMELSRKYGEVYTIYLGSRPVVVVTGYKTVKEVLVDRGDEFLSRGEMCTLNTYYRDYGVAFACDVNRWRELRRFSVTALRDFGMGKKSIEYRIQEESMFLVAELKKTTESVIYPHQLLSLATGNVVSSIMFGQRYDYEDEEFNTILASIYECFKIMSSAWGQLYEMFPRIMRYLPGDHQRIFRLTENLLNIVEKKALMNQKTLDPNNSRDYIDAFLIKMDKEKNNTKTEFHMTNLICSTLQIFFAGVETIANTLTYSFLIVMKYPDILDKIHKEIDTVIGRNREPNVQDRNQMPYTEAVLHEIQRYIDIIPMGVPRKTTQDVHFKGYVLPKGTTVFPMLGSVLKDPTCFQWPMEFNPQNFLDENGKFKKNDAFMPLSAGKRNCLGESLARMQLFLIFVNILQNFNLKSPVPLEELDLTPNISGLGNFPKPYTISFIPR